MSGTWDDGSAGDRFRLVPAAYLLLRREGQVLLQLRRGTGYMDGHWAAGAAGHVEPGESAVAAAVREAAEELGVRVAPTDLVPLTVQHRGIPGGPALEQRVDFYFAADHWDGELQIREPERTADLRWFPLVALPDPVVPHELPVLRGLHDGVLPAVLTFGL
ncbi:MULTISPECIES: NUDIX domain-containing protein [unclassified Isoptericola]|uniref:NUDIX domain-containing protein n=1 Tax=unclassified Isoptericola TaxID=2623355 RepID=UPI00271274FB|nr:MULTISPECIES: NUDIX domain-containing protein [unclassified Isoptericola]MDO8144680.1 NUDIX domain-containing protein [Isoptericola sp. 178]MDO8148526.1 NUDIX domain-containing protein [Isoptericola sp. b515]